MEALEFRVLGPLEVACGDGLVELGGPKQRAVLATLLLRPNKAVSTTRIAEALWGDDPPGSAVGVLRTYVSRFRRLLGAHPGVRLVRQAPGYALEVDPDWVDAWCFEQLVAQGRQALASGHPAAAVTALDRALGLWRGEVLADLTENRELFRADEMRLGQLRLAAAEDRMEAELALGHHAEMVGELEALTAQHPFHERFWCQLMIALYRSGRQTGALAAFQTARSALIDNTGLDPSPELRALERQVLDHAPEIRWSPPLGQERPRPAGPQRVGAVREGGWPFPPHGALPVHLTRFFGREAEVTELADLVQQARLVNLVGAPGCGKTRLATEVGRRLTSGPVPGARFVDLAAVPDSAGIAAAVGLALGIREQPGRAMEETLTDALGAAEPLVVLVDNCEHVAGGVADLAQRLMVECPSLRVIATSRIRLGVAGEQVWNVPPLGPAAAAALFVDRARSVSNAFRVNGTQADAVDEICERLDHLPLPIELAAALTRVLSLSQIAEWATRSTRLFAVGDRGTSPRHETMAEAIDWSYRLLPGGAQPLFEELSVFAGGFDLEAARAVSVSNPDEDVVRRLATLVDHSLLTAGPDPGGEMRYRMLEPVRQHAEARLVASGASDRIRRRHAEHYLALALRFDPWGLRGDHTAATLSHVEREEANLLAALAWARARHPVTGLRLGHAMGQFWEFGGRVNDGRRWLGEILAAAARAGQDPQLRTLALTWAGRLSWRQGDYEPARRFLDEALELADQLGDPGLSARVLGTLAIVAFSEGDAAAAMRLSQESLDLASGGGEAVRFMALLISGWAHYTHGDVPGGDEQVRAALAVNRATGNPTATAHALMALQHGAFLAGDVVALRAHLVGALAAMEEGGLIEPPDWLGSCVGLAVGEGRYRSAARVAGGCEALRIRRGSQGVRQVSAPLWELSDQVDQELTPALVEQIKAEGAQMPWEELAAEALAEAAADTADDCGSPRDRP